MSQRSIPLYVGPSILGGRGVFALEPIAADSLIEICPVIVIPADQVALIHQTILHDYYFLWGENEKEAAIAMGYGSLYNHAVDSNATYEMDFELLTIDIYAIKPIQAGEEITINYHGVPGIKDKLWF